MATHPLSPKPHVSALLPREYTYMHTKAPTLCCRHTHTHTLPSAHRRSLLINIASILSPHHSSKHATHRSRAQGVHPYMCSVHTLTRKLIGQKPAHSSQVHHSRLALVAFGPGEGMFLSGRRLPGHSGSGGLEVLQALQRPSGSRLLLWPGQGGRNSTGWLPLLYARPSTMRPSTGNSFAPDPAGP